VKKRAAIVVLECVVGGKRRKKVQTIDVKKETIAGNSLSGGKSDTNVEIRSKTGYFRRQ